MTTATTIEILLLLMFQKVLTWSIFAWWGKVKKTKQKNWQYQ